MGRIVAIKVLPRDKSTPEAMANFTREIQALAKLDHRHLVRALDAGQDGNVYYLVTEYVPGTDLRKLVRRDGPLSMELAAAIISQVAEGLQHAHEQGLIHRDVKPGNVLVTPEGTPSSPTWAWPVPWRDMETTRATARSWARSIISRRTTSRRPAIRPRPGTSTRWAARFITR